MAEEILRERSVLSSAPGALIHGRAVCESSLPPSFYAAGAGKRAKRSAHSVDARCQRARARAPDSCNYACWTTTQRAAIIDSRTPLRAVVGGLISTTDDVDRTFAIAQTRTAIHSKKRARNQMYSSCTYFDLTIITSKISFYPFGYSCKLELQKFNNSMKPFEKLPAWKLYL